LKDAHSARKVQAVLGIEAKVRVLPRRLDFNSKSIIAERVHRGEAPWGGFDAETAVEASGVIAELSLEEGVSRILALLEWSDGQPPEDIAAAVIADVGFCETLMEEASEMGGSAVSRALSQIEKHFEVFEALDPVFGLPEEIWRPIVKAWKAEFSIPADVVRDAGRNVFRGQKPGGARRRGAKF
jgi:hypothetical protein